jgi:phage terminase small subunit
MAAMTRAEQLDALIKANPNTRLDRLNLYLDALDEYRLAQGRVASEGPIVLHPRTGAPIDNPFLRIREKAFRKLNELKVKADALWQP